MEFGSVKRDVYINAAPDLVYTVISRPEHIRRWWADDAQFDGTSGATGSLTFGDRATSPDLGNGRVSVVPLTVLEAVPNERFVFRWDYGTADCPTQDNSLLVTFRLVAEGAGTRLTVTEEGFRERGWEAAVLEDHYRRHAHGWAAHLGDLKTYVEELSEAGAR